MGWFNYFGLIIMAVIMLPNILWAIRKKQTSVAYINKTVGLLEQIGRYGCFILMIFNIPYTYLNFWFENALIIYLTVNGTFCILYLLFWIIYWNRNNLVKGLSLSILPTLMFLFCGIVLAYIPLVIFSALFGICHIYLSCKASTIK